MIYGLGMVVAFVMSFSTWNSIAWGLVHMFLSWIYVFYWMIFLGDW